VIISKFPIIVIFWVFDRNLSIFDTYLLTYLLTYSMEQSPS